jgi:hypothetical protein
MYRSFAKRSWDEILPDVKPYWRDIVAAMVRYDSGRATARQVLSQL